MRNPLFVNNIVVWRLHNFSPVFLIYQPAGSTFVKNKSVTAEKYIQALTKQVEQLTLRLQQAEDRIANLEAVNNTLKSENAALKNENAALRSENSELRSRLNQNSKNSSRPPSSDGYKKKPALPKKKKGKQGGQTGHKGKTLLQVDNPDNIIICKPGQCTCGHRFKDEETRFAGKRQVFDLPEPRLEVTEYKLYKASCPVCGLQNNAITPSGVNAPVQYGNGVKAYMVLLNTHFKIPFKKIQLLFDDLFGYAINESTVYSATEQCYDKLAESEEIIKSKITLQPVAHADETGIRSVGKLQWLHTATTKLYTYLFVHEKRGREALTSSQSILNRFKGWLIHDCWSSYFKFNGMKHGLCGAHIIRELQGLMDNNGSKWAKMFLKFLLDVYETPFEQRIRRRDDIETRYLRICKIGDKEEPPPVKTPGKRGRYKRTKGRNLVERLMREEKAVMAFAFNKEVPFTNNLAERDIRPAKIKQKISNGFRTAKGASIFARIEGFVSTARKHDQNVFKELRNTFEGGNFITLGAGK